MSEKRLFIGISCFGNYQCDEFLLANFSAMIFTAGVNWVRPENYHLTLKFLGNVDSDKRRKLHNMLSKIKAAPFELQLDGTECLNHTQLVILAELSPELDRLQRQVKSACLGIGQTEFYPNFLPHVTVGKIKDPSAKDMEVWKNQEFRSKARVTEIHVYESVQVDGKTEYHVLESYPLEG